MTFVGKVSLPTKRPLHSFKKEWRGLWLTWAPTSTLNFLDMALRALQASLRSSNWVDDDILDTSLSIVSAAEPPQVWPLFSQCIKCYVSTHHNLSQTCTMYYIKGNCPTSKGILELTLKPEQSETTHCKSKCQFSKVQFSSLVQV